VIDGVNSIVHSEKTRVSVNNTKSMINCAINYDL